MFKSNPNQKFLSFFASLLFTLTLTTSASAAADDAAKAIAIQNHGRVKSFDAFCRQWVETVSGREHWHRQSSVATVLHALAHKETIFKNQWIRVGYRPLAEQLGLATDRSYFAYDELRPGMDKIETLLEQSKAKRDKDVRPSKIEQETELVYSRLVAVHELATGENMTVIPGNSTEAWQSPFTSDEQKAKNFRSLITLFGEKKDLEFKNAAEAWIREIDETTHFQYRKKIEWEILYHSANPFRWAWILYLIAFILISLFGANRILRYSGVGAFLAGFGFHTLGLALRILILERPPVSNMYESMVYMSWALVVFAIALWAIFKSRPLLSVSALIAALVVIYGSLLPIDANMDVLVPVLRSNYWLLIHVMTIVASYGAFGLAMGLGHRHLILHFANKFSSANETSLSVNLIYQTIQIGVLLLGAGTILGGVWANESWGRFWGWDPKETWALITFLAYLFIIHLKFSGKIDHFWMAISSILGFLFVLMTWYGVNFVLGRGLHSYGSGSGGLAWILYYLAAEALFFVWLMWKLTRKKN